MDEVILASFEGLKTVDHDYFYWWGIVHLVLMKEETVSTDSCDVTVDCFRCNLQISGDLSIRHPANSLHDDLGIKV